MAEEESGGWGWGRKFEGEGGVKQSFGSPGLVPTGIAYFVFCQNIQDGMSRFYKLVVVIC